MEPFPTLDFSSKRLQYSRFQVNKVYFLLYIYLSIEFTKFWHCRLVLVHMVQYVATL